MNKQEKSLRKAEMAEWLSTKILKRKVVYEIDNCLEEMKIQNSPDYEKLEKFIYSPEGFFAVWDAIEKKFPEQTINLRFKKNISNYSMEIETLFCEMKPRYGKDRYEAFYNAVYEAMKAL